jgi:hypothetical protein
MTWDQMTPCPVRCQCLGCHRGLTDRDAIYCVSLHQGFCADCVAGTTPWRPSVPCEGCAVPSSTPRDTARRHAMRSAALNAVRSMFAPGANRCVAAPSAAARSRRNGTMRAIAHRRADRRLTASVDIRRQYDRAACARTFWPAASAQLGGQRTAAAAWHLVQRLLWPALVDRAAAPRRAGAARHAIRHYIWRRNAWRSSAREREAPVQAGGSRTRDGADDIPDAHADHCGDQRVRNLRQRLPVRPVVRLAVAAAARNQAVTSCARCRR